MEPRADFFEHYRPVLKVIQTQDPSMMPFGKYLAPTGEAETKIDPPMYARVPGFQFDLSILMEGKRLTLDVPVGNRWTRPYMLWEGLSKNIRKVQQTLKGELPWKQIECHLNANYPTQLKQLLEQPSDICDDHTVRHRTSHGRHMFNLWVEGADLTMMER
jgi:hypothetical protein